MSEERAPGQQALLASALHTVEKILMPELQSAWARSSAICLMGQLRYAIQRLDSTSLRDQDDALDDVISALTARHPELADVAGDDGESAAAGSGVAAEGLSAPEPSEARGRSFWLRKRAGRLLVHAEGASSEAARAVREELRPVVVAQSQQEFAESAPLLQAFVEAGSTGGGSR